MTTRQLAEKLDIASVTVTMYEKGKHPIPYNVAVKLADILEIEASFLYYRLIQQKTVDKREKDAIMRA